jgi:4-hydroxybenzoate polyprenyltransferase
MTSKQNHTDIITKGWVEYVPAFARPYLYLMRLDRPIGTWLLLLPALWAILLSGGVGEWRLMVLFAIGAVIMRGAGCVINDFWDRDLDGKIERTATRPIPSGDVSLKSTIIFILLLLLSGLFVLVQLNKVTILLGFLSLFFVVIYPLMKRITWWPQAFLGLTFNFGTIYAMQDRGDDALVGVKSSARYITEKLNNHMRKIIYLFYFVHFILFFMIVFSILKNEFYTLYGLCVLPLMHLIWQVKTMQIDNHKNTLRRFQSNRDYGLLWCILIVIFLLYGGVS